ncbi:MULTISPECIES: hypothetical protein [Citrobacter]|uniref:hypothetical protein n=1 Tax=Citrobacter TaxID=544 RepID=UPI00177C9975|nr:MULTISPECIES: hypothetical protein [Citrobacter]MBD9992957.1 hypothetical protein [Citrobacter freundii]MBE0055990.1 hypothetical protein [Citrobacter freundii]MDM3386769.1 hypothetical protein [Citrobacter sp. Cb011]MDT7290736.1 hypothetical protein [Citrobacter freundii]MEB6429305.1 hypothetical protein [Citrobacter freundii]
MDLLLAILSILLIVLILRASFTHGIAGRFLYVDKRKKDVTLHMAIFGTPRNKKGVHKLTTSFINALKKLKKNGYVSVSMDSHLIDSKRLAMLHRLALQEGYTIVNVRFFPTPRLQHILTPVSMALLRFKIVRVKPQTCSLTIIL